MKKLFAIIVVCGMLLGTAMPIAAANASSTVQPRFTYIDEVRANLQVSDWGVACCNGTLIAKVDNPVMLTLRLQEFDGSNWMTIKKWDITGTGSTSAARNYAIYSGFTYRLQVTAYIYDAYGNLLESASAYNYIDY